MVRQTRWEGKPASGMGRREFIALLGGAAVAGPLSACSGSTHSHGAPAAAPLIAIAGHALDVEGAPRCAETVSLTHRRGASI